MTTLHRAAFGDRPDLPVTAVPAAGAARWLAAVALGGQGRYAAAATLLPGLIAGRDPVLGSLAASTLAAHRRQLGAHAAARPLDAAALRRLAEAGPVQALVPDSVPDSRTDGAPAAWSDALLGLAADALGLGRTGEARRLVAAAGRLGDAGWRGSIRLGWVSAEIELGAGRPDAAVRPAEEAAERAGASGSTRHRIKSGLVLGAALAAGGANHGERAIRVLRAAEEDAAGLGLLPLVWPCALLLADLEPTRAGGHRRRAGHALHTVLRRTDPIGRRLALGSPWVPDPRRLTG